MHTYMLIFSVAALVHPLFGAQKANPEGLIQATNGLVDKPMESQQVQQDCCDGDEQAEHKIDRAVYRSITRDHMAVDVTAKVNNLISKNGPGNWTGFKNLNQVFKDPAPNEGKILRISKGKHFIDLKESVEGVPHHTAYDLHRILHPPNNTEQPSVFIAVFSRRSSLTRRSLVRPMWQHVALASSNITVKFALCDAADENVQKLKDEADTYGDLIILPCNEGYGEGALTLKVLAAMSYYRVMSDHLLFMKIDDDTFTAWSRFSDLLIKRGHQHAYMGIPIDEGTPCRNSSFRWYEPYWTFNATYFPKAMSGGSGYTLGRALVRLILDSGVGYSNVLWNEDRATGVWIDSLMKENVDVEFVEVPGIDGWWSWDWEHPMHNWLTWADYPYFVHHGLHAESIACLAKADEESDPWKPIDRCFAVEVGEKYEPLVCAQQTEEKIEAEKAKKDDK